MTPVAGVLVLRHGHVSQIVNMHYSFKNLLLYSQAKIQLTKYIAVITKEGPNKIVNFITLGAGILMLGRGHISHYSEYVLYSTISIYGISIVIVLKDYDAAFLYTVGFHLFYDGAVDSQI